MNLFLDCTEVLVSLCGYRTQARKIVCFIGALSLTGMVGYPVSHYNRRGEIQVTRPAIKFSKLLNTNLYDVSGIVEQRCES